MKLTLKDIAELKGHCEHAVKFKYYNDDAIFSAAQVAPLLAALEKSQEMLRKMEAASCDGCTIDDERFGYCAVCGADTKWNDDYTGTLLVHADNCDLKAALLPEE